ncbi:MAG: putative translation initiation factor, aIF-2BI family [Clostridiaceae bacterium]|jgi:methylthioribose-1-phosphate isomerase|nr:putative translation initiation factor, aIF-2BI family [Clostridiaceae bacterium]
MGNVNTIQWKDDKLFLIDCTKLPEKEEYIVCSKYTVLCKAIKELAVRGAPAIGVSAAYGVVLAALEASKCKSDKEYNYFIKNAIKDLSETRPTAVNLFWALNKMENKFNSINNMDRESIKNLLLEEANTIYKYDIKCNEYMGQYGNAIVPGKANILTHCNAGALATAGYGTALGVIRAAHSSGKHIHVYADETRPLLQGARLTCWELMKDNIPTTLLCDNMAGYAMQLGKIDLVITGADRITSKGDTANKIGTYSVAVLAKENRIPFYVAAPLSTIDLNLRNGSEIKIEERDQNEVKELFGVRTAPAKATAFNPAFDITPNKYITGIITEKGILTPPFEESIAQVFKK